MVSGQKKLTEPPKDLKEAIDWLALVGGGFGGDGLGKHDALVKALEKLPVFDGVKTTVFGDKSVQSAIRDLANGLGYGFLGYNGSLSVGGSGIAQSDYQSTYKEATWDDSDQDKDIPQIFLCAASMVFWGLTYVYWKCKVNGGWSGEPLNNSVGWGLGKFMKDMGFQASTLRSIKGFQVASRLDNGGAYTFEELNNADKEQYSYPAFILSLERSGPEKGINSPLTNCFVLAKKYFRDRFQNGKEIDGSLTSIKETLKKFSTLCYTYSFLKDEINKFISTNMPDPSSPNPSNNAEQSSPAGAVAGTLTTLGLGGGATAAYLFNLGGTKTFVNGLF
ncbi:variant erythrocyte surface antigen-1 family protein [Babesia caballi]|uniref:Variant erythrocyte surface antigen-1 family protein n=1 Tax=Babesia caballi TaxID=5871 RepID=A0AAV4LRW9_BABCB|nr:variant erythrocyte surface antigen-1 family protein [Babesia caballi]